MKQLFVHVST